MSQLRASLEDFGRVQSLASSTLDALVESARTISTPARQALFRRGDEGQGLFVVASGEYRVSLFSPEGREQIVRLVGTGRLIVDAFAPAGRGAALSAFARVDSDAWEVPRARIEELAGQDAALGRCLVEALAYRHARAVDRIFDLSLRTVDQRLAAFLLEQSERSEADQAGLTLERELDVSTIAGLLGTVREEISRSQRRLAERGLIEVSRQRVTILDLEGLRAFA